MNFRQRNYVFSRLELVDKDELFPQAPMHPAYRIGAYTFGGVRDLVQDRAWQLGLGADVTIYSKPAVLDSSYRQLSRLVPDIPADAARTIRRASLPLSL